MSWIAQNSLIEIADLNLNVSFGACDGTEVPNMAVPADPDARAFRDHTRRPRGVKPFIKLSGIASHVSVGRSGHLQTATAQ